MSPLILLTWPSDRFRLFESMIPLGLAHIGAVLEQRGYAVKIVDFNHYRGDFLRDLRRWRPSVIGIGGTTPTRRGSFLTARIAKRALPNVPVIYGGVHATFAARDTLMHVPEIDYVVKGEGEFAFADLCDTFVNDRRMDFSGLPGLCYRWNGGVVENACRRIDDLAGLPLPARHLFPHAYPMTLDFFNVPADFLVTSRGCPVRCSFCSASSMFPGGVRLRPMEQIREEIDVISRRKEIRAIKLFDSTFTAVRDHAAAFCETIGRRNLMWECEVRADSVDRELLREMRNAGCVYVNVGLETSDQTLLRRIGKGIRVEQVEQALHWCRELGIRTKVFFTFGHAGQTRESCRRDLAYIKQHRESIDFFATTVGMRVYPGTALERWARREGMVARDFSWARFRPSWLRNIILAEPGDVMVLRQPGLGTWRLLVIALSLLAQRTVMSRDYAAKIAWQNLTGIAGFVRDRLRYARHRLERRFAGV